MKKRRQNSLQRKKMKKTFKITHPKKIYTRAQNKKAQERRY
jgi:hypothetical protein